MSPTLRILQMALELWGAFFTLSCALTAIFTRKASPYRNNYLAALLSLDTLLLISDAAAYGYRGVMTPFAFVMVPLSNAFVFALIPIMVYVFARYTIVLIQQHQGHLHRVWIHLVRTFCGLHLLVLLFSCFTGFVYYIDDNNLYHRAAGPGYLIVTLLGVMELAILAAMIFRYRHHIDRLERICLLLYIFLPLGCSIVQIFHYGLSLNNIAATISLLLLFLTSEIQKAEHQYQQQLISVRQEAELAEARLQVSLAQMQPHFIFNALGSIEQLCRIDADRAAKATHYFAKYLRNNLHAVNVTDLQNFSDELAHTRAYIWLEKMRFGDELSFTEDISTTEFKLPVLTIQPLVEHAISRGLMDSEDTRLAISVHAREEEDCYRIIIFDNSPAQVHITDSTRRKEFEQTVFYTISERLRITCSGSITEETLPGKGTQFVITIPK